MPGQSRCGASHPAGRTSFNHLVDDSSNGTLQGRMANNPDTTLDRTFAALADPTRRAIVSRLLTGDLTVMDLAEPFEMSLPAVSKHIAILARAGLVTQSKRGRERWCRLDVGCLSAAARWMESFGRVAEEDWARLEMLIEETEGT